jgi:RNA polymerase sigma-70 factor (ECF subfamily)
LYRRAVALTGSRHAAEDALHDAYVKLAVRPDRLVQHPSPYAYALVTVANTVRDAWRRHRREQLHDESVDDGVRWDGGIEVREAEWEVMRLLSNVTHRQAVILLLVDVEGRTIEQTASLMGLHPGTISRARGRALDKLRTLLRRDDAGRFGGER